jgi:hypothetical protein
MLLYTKAQVRACPEKDPTRIPHGVVSESWSNLAQKASNDSDTTDSPDAKGIDSLGLLHSDLPNNGDWRTQKEETLSDVYAAQDLPLYGPRRGRQGAL